MALREYETMRAIERAATEREQAALVETFLTNGRKITKCKRGPLYRERKRARAIGMEARDARGIPTGRGVKSWRKCDM